MIMIPFGLAGLTITAVFAWWNLRGRHEDAQ